MQFVLPIRCCVLYAVRIFQTEIVQPVTSLPFLLYDVMSLFSEMNITEKTM
jgi:hypothetical protein